MNKIDTGKILTLINAHIPQQYRQLTKTTKENILLLWQMKFKEYNYKEVEDAVNRYIDTDIKGFMPTVGLIKSHMYKITNPIEKTELESWNEVFKSLNKPDLQKEFDKFDAVTQRIIGSKQILYQWAMMDSNQVQSVIASNFQRSYRALAAGEKERQIASPGGCKQLETKKPLKIKGGE